jgi:hypothetical protein
MHCFVLTKFPGHSEKLQLLSIDEKAVHKNDRFKTLDADQQCSIDTLTTILRIVVKEANDKLKSELVARLENMQKERLAEEEKKYVEQQRQLDETADLVVLGHLNFASKNVRRDEIHDAHRTTFSWIFKDPEIVRASGDVAENTRPWNNFVEWLKRGKDIYWINGKAGSGKSTLMRYIVENAETFEHLREWADPAELRVASFYFWHSGLPEQRSQSGLFRSLLYEILCQRPDLVRHVFREEWEIFRSTESKVEQMAMLERVHSFRRLKVAFAYLVSLASDELKLCFFIDGLDEYEGQGSEGPETIINIFKSIPISPNLKICLSSRPWVAFENAFNKGPNLRLQDLTYRDIRVYVRDRLESDHRILQLSEAYPAQKEYFVREILSKANGVFLWVSLVITSLLTGLTNRDDISDLQNRLKGIPPDLEEFYGYMLKGISKDYIEKASRIFQIYNSASDVDVRPTVLELDLAVTATYADSMTSERKVMSEENIQKRCDRMITQLKVACGGLLEAHDHLDSHWEAKEDSQNHLARPAPTTASTDDEQEINKTQTHKIKADSKVSYLHRTVSDFLKKDSTRAYLESNTSKSDSFDPNLSLLMSYLINLKQSICSFYIGSYQEPSLDFRVWRVTNDFCHIAQKVDSSKGAFVLALLNEFNLVAPHWWQKKTMLHGSKFRDRDAPSKSKKWLDGIFLVAIRFGLCSFVQDYLQTYPIPLGLPGYTILMYALGLSLEESEPFVLLKQPSWPAIVEILLQRRQWPNKVVKNGCHTVWQYYLKAYRTESANVVNSDKHCERWALIIKSMLEHDADITDTVMEVDPPDLTPWIFETIQDSDNPATKRHSLEALINDLAAKTPPDTAALLRDAYQRRKHLSAPRGTPSPASSSSPRKRPHETCKESITPTGAVCIEIDDDDGDESSIRSASRSRERLGEIKGTSPGKRTRFDLM